MFEDNPILEAQWSIEPPFLFETA